MEISLYCLILGYSLDNAVTISVPYTADVDLLRQRLKETREEIADVKTTKLELLWVNISLDDAESKLALWISIPVRGCFHSAKYRPLLPRIIAFILS
jgi:hypothetical protein